MPLLYYASFKEFGSLVCPWHDVKLRKTQLEVRSFNPTWSRDLWGQRVIFFLEMCQIVGWTAMANLAALRAAVFPLSTKNLTGGLKSTPPPVRGLTINKKAHLQKNRPRHSNHQPLYQNKSQSVFRHWRNYNTGCCRQHLRQEFDPKSNPRRHLSDDPAACTLSSSVTSHRPPLLSRCVVCPWCDGSDSCRRWRWRVITSEMGMPPVGNIARGAPRHRRIPI